MNWKVSKLKLCVVGLIVAVLGVLAYPGIKSSVRINRPGLWAVRIISNFRVACNAYKYEYGTYPEISENAALVKVLNGDNHRHIVFMEFNKKNLNANGEVIDLWGTPLRFSFSETEGLRLWSAGKDHLFDTKDDFKR